MITPLFGFMHCAVIKSSDILEEHIDCVFRVTYFFLQYSFPIDTPNLHFQVFIAVVDHIRVFFGVSVSYNV